MEYAIIETGGKQYRVSPGMLISVDNLSDQEKGDISFDRVLLYVKDSEVNLGKPYLKGFVVKAKLIKNFKGVKIRVARFKAKSRYRKVRGHRQSLSEVQIEKIEKTPKERQI
ncbi:MAG: 50S ribosomal protein L21 [Candidatus Levybacteria bacterium RIFCSPHIGHO2_02_FULL_39_36]|nr:MAG: 50S ribosomal protein L21 [Candidatus Levybacteria bacterium GW2011_GWA1_39_11]KKR24593.1 MAG: 50S ribosomal protein L21 [Candidatus Levybacteria bacterium GW2011_GWB1_39_7]OGH15346.1 MAG: 50S ribosomal protein L21 [Candidatus Levybacteria bacterium RIFCSPHIGHO2_01_FULL_38_96]OGH26001.1 MAG: 50S ribosomal protein L21 [Candidatus Levybacteria bacterium RIFCSPHIGHO2_12_FULL_39_39]OGH28843.1 MAG: 50S ribosomal protein L21 [Candidatus Levybacteria bacterium RIFCSPHIGHO2_02_FULL_39_36]OGH36